jgi:hypothetical protein
MEMMDLATLTHQDINEIISADPTAGCANCSARYSDIWWLVTAPEGCEALGGIKCHTCAGASERQIEAWANEGEDVTAFSITRVPTREQVAQAQQDIDRN